jgi:hypothetical protein
MSRPQMPRIHLFALAVAVCVAACGGGPAPSSGLGDGAGDPTRWTRRDLGVDGPRIHAVTPGGPGFVGVGAAFPGDDTSSAIYTSPDALTWTVVDEPKPGRSLGAVVAGGPGFVAASSSPPAIWTSPDGLAWTESASSDAFGETTTLLSLSAVDGLMFAGAHDGLFTSSDGIDWQRADLGGEPEAVNDVARSGAGYVAVGSSLVGSMESKGAVWTSTDGLAWDRLPDDPVFARASLYSVAAHDGLLVATGYASDPPGAGSLFARPSAWTSRDGTTWERSEVVDPTLPVRQTTTGALEGALMTSLARTEAGWLAAGTALTAEADAARFDAAIWTSADGETWQRVPHDPAFVAGRASGMEYGAFSLAVSDDRVVVVGRTTGPQTTLWINE